MSSPVQISDLPVATVANDNDLLLLRSGLTDYQCAVSLIRQINIQALSPVPGGSPAQTDLLLVGRVVAGVPRNFSIQFCQAGFPKGTKMWFWNRLPPAPNWSLVTGTGDKLLAVQSNNSTYSGGSGGSSAGTWQQVGVSLTIDQIPAHTHEVDIFPTLSTSSDHKLGSGKNSTPGSQTSGPTGGAGSTSKKSTNPPGATNPHNHGNTWRPLANVGVIGNKDY